MKASLESAMKASLEEAHSNNMGQKDRYLQNQKANYDIDEEDVDKIKDEVAHVGRVASLAMLTSFSSTNLLIS